MANDKTNFNMQLTTTQREIMDFVTEVVFDGYGYSKAEVVNLLFKNNALNYLSMSIEPHEMSDEIVLALLLQAKRTKDVDSIAFTGVELYEKLIAINKKKGLDTSYNEELLKEYKEREVK